MFKATSQTRFNLATNDLKHEVQAFSFIGQPSISTPFSFELERVSEPAGLNIGRLLHTPAFMAFNSTGAGIGPIYRVAQSDGSVQGEASQ